MDSPRLLVVGAGGTVGQAVALCARLAGIPTFLTFRQREIDAIQFNAEAADSGDIEKLVAEALRRSVSTAILTFGQSGYDRCDRDPVGTKRVNVDAVFEAAKFFNSVGIRVCAISSSAVFSGLTRLPTESSATDPRTEYGRQKVQMEELLSELENVTVLRLTKVLTLRHGLVATWVRKLRAGVQVEAYANVRVAPIWPIVAGQAILSAVVRYPASTVHLSPADDMSYAELAAKLAHRYSLPGRVVPVDARGEDLRGLRPGGYAALGSIFGLSPLKSFDTT